MPKQRGLKLASFDSEGAFVAGLGSSVLDGADVANLRFGVSASLARTLYAASDAVLANSVSEPFGLVGLEAMAAGGVAYTGGTGEDYAIAGRNAVVLETLDPAEIIRRWEELASSPGTMTRLRREARKTARDYEWRSVIAILIDALERQGQKRGLLADIVAEPAARAAHAPLARRRGETQRRAARSRDVVEATAALTRQVVGRADLFQPAAWAPAFSPRDLPVPTTG